MNGSRPALILALGLVVASLVFSFAFVAARAPKGSIVTTGSARKQVASDRVTWKLAFFRTVKEGDVPAGQAQLQKDLQAVLDYLAAAGIKDGLDVSPATLMENYQGGTSSGRSYNLRRAVGVESRDIAKIRQLAQDISPLTDRGILVATEYLGYTYSRLPDERVDMLGTAIKDARQRAEEIARSDGRTVGPVSSVSVGPVQVLAPGSVDVADGGAYDTSTVDKEIMVTVRAEFRLQ